MKPWGAFLIVGLLCSPGLARGNAPAPGDADLIGLLLEDPIAFALEVQAAAPAEPMAPDAVADAVAVALAPPAEPSPRSSELAARAFDITYTFAYPDSVRRAGADR